MAEEYAGQKFGITQIDGEAEGMMDEAEELAAASRKIFEGGLTSGAAGNISVRHLNGFIVKVGGVSMKDAGPGDFVFVSDYDSKQNVASVYGRKNPSSETPTHYAVYKKFPGINAIVHAHDEVVLKHKTEALKLGATETKTETDYGTRELARQVLDALSESDYVIIMGHGIVAVGASLDEALGKAFSFHDKVGERLV